MATIRKRGNRWQAQVRKQGNRGVSRSFHLREDALAWVRKTEIQIERGDLRDKQQDIEGLTLAHLLNKYLEEVTPRKKVAANETLAIKAFLRHAIAPKLLRHLSPADFASYRDIRLTEVKASTFNREMNIISHAFQVAIEEWNWPIRQNPISRIRRPQNEQGRQRRLSGKEFELLMAELNGSRNPSLRPIVLFAIETGMRQSEIVRMEWNHLNLTNSTLHIPLTKNGTSRTIPLSTRAKEILSSIEVSHGKVFPTTPEAIKRAWIRLVARAGILDLHFHDLRHEAISRLFERGLSVPEVALISGHRDYRMLFRYTHLKPESLVEKLG